MKNLKVLIVDGSVSEVLRIVRQISEAGYEVAHERVDTAEKMLEALGRQTWDIVVAESTMPGFSGREALRVLRGTGSDKPFVLVSDTVSEQVAMEMMEAGAQDIIEKDDLARLVPVIVRELREAEIRRQHRGTDEALRTSERNFRALFEYVPAAVFAYDRNGTILYANSECTELFDIPEESMVGHSLFDSVARGKDREEVQRRIEYVFSGGSVRNIEWLDKRPNGREVYMLTNVTPVFGPDGTVMLGLSLNMDITERKLVEQRERELAEDKREFYRRTILAATEGKLEICDQEQIQRLAGQPIASWEIRNAEDTRKVRHAIASVAEAAGMEDFRVYDLALCAGEAMTNAIKHAHGGTVSLHKVEDSLLLIVSDHGPGIEALNLPDVALTRGYTTAGTLGMGYKTMMSLADRVYLATGASGTTVAIKMSLAPMCVSDPWNLEPLAGPAT